MKKELLEGYVGIKYTSICSESEAGADCDALYTIFRECGRRLAEHGMTPANGGNMSQKLPSGEVVITTAGCNLSSIEPCELVAIEACSLSRREVSYHGSEQPSSEAMLHWLIYRDFPTAGAVLHAHDEVGTSVGAAAGLPETPTEEPYGTVALAKLAADTFSRARDIIVLKNHGYVAYGNDLTRATERVVAMHLELLGSSQR